MFAGFLRTTGSMKKIFSKAFCCLVLVGSFVAIPALALDNGLAKTPLMGWNSWNKFACDVSEDLIRSIADAMVSSGLKDASYEYVVIDDCWQVARDDQGNIIPDPKRFPHGMKALSGCVANSGGRTKGLLVLFIAKQRHQRRL
jgi:alpha-galactosidase